MSNKSSKSQVEELCKIISEISPSLSFTIFEIGALPITGAKEPFHNLVDYFPKSQIIAFEVDERLCRELNEKSKPNLNYFPVALGCKDDECTFYETAHPMCSSLYEPNGKLLEKYMNLEVATLKSTSALTTTSLNKFVYENSIKDADFIKIDIQGAELDVFRGGASVLKDIVFIVCEVEFIPLYINQPLFGDVCKYLSTQNLMFHKFLGIAGRTIKPIVMNNNPNFASQHMWSDAVFIRDIDELPKLSSTKLLKLGILAYIYGSKDVSYLCFKTYDERAETNIAQEMLSI